MEQRKHLSRLILFAVLLMGIGFPSTASAQNVDGMDFVYGTNHYNGATYSSTVIPETVDTVYLLADHPSILAARLTHIYYWPITNEYKADWDSANIIVEGTLEVLKDNKLHEEVCLSEYVIQYDSNDMIDTSVLYTGQEAIAARENYESLQAKYRDDLYAYYKVLNEYSLLYQTALSQLQKGLITEEQLPEAPIALVDFTLFSTEVLYGFPINLPTGEYDIRLRLEDGSILPGSQKRLVVFDSVGEGIGYSIAGEERWNLPEDSRSGSEVIYGLENGTYYVQPVHQKLYNERYYLRMNNPQEKTSHADRTLWVPFKSAEGITLNLTGINSREDLKLQPFFVEQILGSKLGYNIVLFDAETMSKPTFTAYKVTLDKSAVYSLHLEGKDGEEVYGSARELRVINTNHTWLVYVVSVFPLAIGLPIVLIRRKRVRNIKVVGVG